MSISTLSILNNGRQQVMWEFPILPSPVQQSLQAAAFYYIIIWAVSLFPYASPRRVGMFWREHETERRPYFI